MFSCLTHPNTESEKKENVGLKSDNMLNLSANCMNSRAFFFFFCSVAGFIVLLRGGAAAVVQVLVFIKCTDTRMEASFSPEAENFSCDPLAT